VAFTFADIEGRPLLTVESLVIREISDEPSHQPGIDSLYGVDWIQLTPPTPASTPHCVVLDADDETDLGLSTGAIGLYLDAEALLATVSTGATRPTTSCCPARAAATCRPIFAPALTGC